MTKPRSVADTANDGSIPGSRIVSGGITNLEISSTAEIDSSKLSFLQDGTEAQVRSVESKLRDCVSVKDFGAVGNGFEDDTGAFVKAINSGARRIIVPEGIYRVTETIKFDTPGSIELVGSGSTPQSGLNQSVFSYEFKGTAIYMDGPDKAIFEFAIDNFLGGSCSIKSIAITSKNDILDQHAILITHNVNTFHLEDVVFMNISGYCWAWNSSSDAYSQNVNWTNISALTVGGIIGTTANAPSPSRGGILCTLFQCDNFNLDQGINQTSPQEYICDFRGMRAITLNTFLLEGNRADNTANEYMIFDCDGSVVIDNLHLEILTNPPPAWFRFTNSPEWYGDANQSVKISGFWGASIETIVFESGSRAKLSIYEFNTPQAVYPRLEDWIMFNGTYLGASCKIDGFDSRRVYRSLVPVPLKGRVQISRNVTTSSSGLANPARTPPLTSVLTPLFRWRPDVDGSFDGINTPYFSTYKESTYSIDEITTFENTRVHRFQQSGSRGAFIGLNVNLPEYMLGAQITIVTRYFFDGNEDRFWEMVAIKSPDNWTGTSGIPLAVETDGAVYGRWATTVATLNAAQASFIVISDSSPLGTGTPDLYLAAYDVFLGGQYVEPLDLRS